MLRVLFNVSSQFVNIVGCFLVMIFCISQDGSMRANLILCFTTVESRVKMWSVKLIPAPSPPPPTLTPRCIRLLPILRRYITIAP